MLTRGTRQGASGLDQRAANEPRRTPRGAGRHAVDRPLRADSPADGFAQVLGPETTAPVAKRCTEGTHRTEAPAETLARLLPRLGDFGITRVARITGFDRAGIEATTVVRPNARGLSVANGKGLSLAAAKVSGIMEAIERWHAERPTLPLRFGDPEDLATTGATVHLDLPRVRPTDDLGPIFWAPALDLTSGARVFVPFDAVHTCWLRQPSAPETPFHATTDGLASGSHPVEAALHGLAELVEHDALALFAHLPAEARAARRVDPATVDDPAVAALLGGLAEQDFALALWDATTDVGAPVLLAALVDGRDRRSVPGFGSGCHADRAVAATRAITEAAQTRLIAMTGARDDLGDEFFAGSVAVRFRWAMREAPDAGGRDWRQAPTVATDDLRADLRGLVAAVTRAGAGPVLAVNLSREPRLSVLRVLVPGLEAAGPGEGVLAGPRAGRAREILT
jgi:YcaO-like protein with predicted kinase domain